MTLTIVNVAYALCTVGNSVGGAEQVLSAIDHALVDAGATSIVVACEGSDVHGVLRATPAPRPAIIDERVHAAARAAHARAIAAALDAQPVDVVHLHGVDFSEYLPAAGVPVLVTLHLPPSWYPADALVPSRPDTFVHCVSESQRRSCPPSHALLPTIPNGVAIPARAPVLGARRGVVALGRICPEKGFHVALAAARRAGVPMILAGRVFPYPAHLEHWTRELVPLLDDARRFIGPVDAQRRTELLAHARCVLIPSLVPETSSLVAMEALAAGTPVVAFGKGALPEIVDHGVTGFLVHDEQEMADAIHATATLDPEACRAAAIARFSVEAMTRRYLERYATLARGATAAADDTLAAHDGQARALPLRRSWQRPQLECTVLSTEPALYALVPEWRRLVAAAGGTPFQRPEWLLPWWRHFGAGAPCLLTVRRGGELVGLAPLYVRHDADGERVLALIGTGNSDYVDALADPVLRDDIAATMIASIVDMRAGWDRCDLTPLPAGSALLTAPAPAGWRAAGAQADVCPVLTLSDATHGVDASLPARFVAQLRYAARRLAREHDVRVDAADGGNARALLDDLFALHAMRWQSRGTAGVLAETRTRDFHREVATAMAEQDLLRLYVMRVNGRLAAAFYGFADATRLYYYLGGFDPAAARYSVGSLVVLHAIEAAAARGAVDVDFLRGGEAYKYRWGAVDRGVYAWRLLPAGAATAEAA